MSLSFIDGVASVSISLREGGVAYMRQGLDVDGVF